MRKQTVLIDMDEVVVDLCTPWLETYEKLGGEHVTRDQLTSYDLRTMVADPKRLYSAIDGYDVLLRAGAFPGALEALQRLYQTHDTYIVTYARYQAVGAAHMHKLSWLARHAPWFDRDRVIFAKHKHLVQGDVLIEDNAETLCKWLRASGEVLRGYMINQPWNTGPLAFWPYETFIERVNSLAEVADILCGADNE